VRLLRETGIAGALVEAGARRVLVVGNAEIIDPGRPWTLFSTPREAAGRAAGLGLYGLRNAADLAGFARDAVLLRTGPIRPRRRVLAAVRPNASAAFDGEQLSGRWGPWPGEPSPTPTDRSAAGAPAVLGWSSAIGPVALPARWDADRSAATLDPAGVSALGLRPESPASVLTDDYGGPGPSPKQGTAIHGFGRLVEDDNALWAMIEPEQLVAWNGASTGSRRRAR
jgi:hypothetical protein